MNDSELLITNIINYSSNTHLEISNLNFALQNISNYESSNLILSPFTFYFSPGSIFAAQDITSIDINLKNDFITFLDEEFLIPFQLYQVEL